MDMMLSIISAILYSFHNSLHWVLHTYIHTNNITQARNISPTAYNYIHIHTKIHTDACAYIYT